MIRGILTHILLLLAVTAFAMAMPALFVWAIVWGNSVEGPAQDSVWLVKAAGSVLMPFGMALWSCVLWRKRAHPWIAFFITAAVIIAMLKLGVYDLEVR